MECFCKNITAVVLIGGVAVPSGIIPDIRNVFKLTESLVLQLSIKCTNELVMDFWESIGLNS